MRTRIRIQIHADPDLVKNFYMKKYYVGGNGPRNIPTWTKKSYCKSGNQVYFVNFGKFPCFWIWTRRFQIRTRIQESLIKCGSGSKKEVLPELGVSCEGVVVGRPAEHHHPAHEQGTRQPEM